ncbi:MAG TPA: N-acetyltransferase [Terriglobales bacterium]|nr:N-acetyltransferase [Terriglobales bacterium]
MFRLRDYDPADFETLWQLDQRCFSHDIAYSRQELAYYLRDKSAICLVAWRETQVAGFVLGHVKRGHVGHIVTLDVDASARRSGLGSTLMQSIEDRFRAAQCDAVLLEVAVNNESALAFYKKHGFGVLKTLRRYYPGELDGLLMGKKLTASC